MRRGIVILSLLIIGLIVVLVGFRLHQKGNLIIGSKGAILLWGLPPDPNYCGAELYSYHWLNASYGTGVAPYNALSICYGRYAKDIEREPDGFSFLGFGYWDSSTLQCHDVFMRVTYLHVHVWLLAAAFLSALLISIGPFRRSIRQRIRRRRGLCVKCGYNLAGNTIGICPECGTKCEPKLA